MGRPLVAIGAGDALLRGGEGANAPHAPWPARGVEGIGGECGKFSRSRATPGEGLGVPGKLADEDRVQILEIVPALPRSDPSLTSRR